MLIKLYYKTAGFLFKPLHFNYKTFLTICAMLLFSCQLFAQLSGTYSVGGSSPDFPTLDSAFNYMERNGITGKVRLNIREGTHTLRTTISSISGAGISRMIQVAPDPMNTSQVIFKNTNTSGSSNFLINLKQGFIRFDSLVFKIDGASRFGSIVDFTANCNSIIFNYCQFYGKDTASTSANFIIIKHTSSYKIDSLTIKNCSIFKGSSAIKFEGPSGKDSKIELKNNKIVDFYHMGIFAFDQDKLLIEGNYLKDNQKYSDCYGMYCRASNAIKVRSNQIYVNGKGGYGFIIQKCNGKSSDKSQIENNFISGYDTVKNSNTFYALFISECEYINVMFNTVASFNKGKGAAVYFNQADVNFYTVVKNNIFYADNVPAVYYDGGTTLGIKISDYNLFYSDKNVVGFYNNYIRSLETLKKSTGLDTHSISKKVSFTSNTNLHTLSIDLYKKGINVQGINTDLDGQSRKSTPDIGADEMDIPTFDLSLLNSVNKLCIGSKDLFIKIKNTGLSKIDSAHISWQISTNGGSFILKSPTQYKGRLNSGQDTFVQLGTHNFVLGSTYRIKAWFNDINGKNDSLSVNDTATIDLIKVLMTGTFTIAGASPDFPTIDSAINTLERTGICGPVKLLVRSGIYNEKVVFNKIPGVSNVNYIEMISHPANKFAPEIYYSSGSRNDNSVLQFNNTSHVRIKGVLFTATGSSFGSVVQFIDTCSDITLDSNTFVGVRKRTSLNINDFAVLNDDGVCNNISIQSCSFKNGIIGINFLGSTVREKNLRIVNNKISDFSYTGIWVEDQEDVTISGNIVNDADIAEGPIGIWVQSINRMKIVSNEVNLGGQYYNCGIQAIVCYGADTSPALMANNIVSLYNKGMMNNVWGIYAFGGDLVKVVNNTVRLESGDTSSRAFFGEFYQLGTAEIYNNNFMNYGAGYSAYFRVKPNKVKTDRNNYFTKGDCLGYYYKRCFTLNEFKSASSADGLSKSVNTLMKHQTIRSKTIDFDGKASPLKYLKTDFYGRYRDTATPDIGAIEFDPDKNDLALLTILFDDEVKICGRDSTQLRVIVKNNGSDTIKSYRIQTKVKSSNSQEYVWIDTINSTFSRGSVDTIRLRKFRSSDGGVFDITTMLINNDNYSVNDTANILTQLINSSPDKLADHVDTICDNESRFLKPYKPAGSFIKWYSRSKNGSLISQSDSLKIHNIMKDSSVYAAAVYTHLQPVKLSTMTTRGGTSCNKGGLMFDLKAYAEMSIDSLNTYFTKTGQQDVLIYIKKGSYQGAETNPAKWKLADSITSGPTNGANGTIVLKKPIKLMKDSVYGIYLYFDAEYTYRGRLDTFQTKDLRIITGSGTCAKFDASTLGRTFSGHIYYSNYIYCESDRARYKFKVNKSPVIDIGKDTSYCSKSGMDIILSPSAGYRHYEWSTGDTTQTLRVNDGGKYAVTVYNEFCKTRDERLINKNMNPQVNFGPDVFYCASKGINMLLDPGPNYKSYKWLTGSNAKNIKVVTQGVYGVSVTDNNGCTGGDTITIVKVQDPKPYIGRDTFFCSADSFSLGIDGGYYPYYLWQDGDSVRVKVAKSKGTYTLKVRDKYGCIGSDSLLIVEKQSPELLLPKDTFYCSGNIPMYLPAGSGYKSYQWSTNETTEDIYVYNKGMYSVIVTGFNNCVKHDTVLVNEKALPVINIGKDTGYCKGQHISLTLDAGLGYKSYRWSNSSVSQYTQVKDRGRYEVAVTDNYGCKGRDTLVIEEVEIKINLGKDTSYCANNGLILTAAPGYSEYQWSDGSSERILKVKQSARYKLVVTGIYGCKGSDSINVTSIPNPIVNLGQDRILNNDLPVNEKLDAGQDFKKYLWNTSETSRSITVSATGSYNIRVTDDNGCEGYDSILVKFWDKSGIDKVKTASEFNFKVVPNPGDIKIKVISDNVCEKLEIYNSIGEKIYYNNPMKAEFEIDVSTWLNGFYIIKYSTADLVQYQRIVVHH